MLVEMFNVWYFLFLILSVGAIVGLYFILKNRTPKTQKIVLFAFLAFGLILHFLKVFIPPYSVDENRMLRDSWFVNICGANIALFPFIFLSKKDNFKDYMFYIGVLSGILAIFYPQEPIAKGDAQIAEIWDVLRFYYHHWMLVAVPLLMVVLKLHKLSYKRVFSAPIGLLLLMLFIILNQYFQAELGFIPLRGYAPGLESTTLATPGMEWEVFFDVNWKNTSYIYGPDFPDGIGKFLSIFCPDFFKKVPVGPFAGKEKYWPWFWLIFPAFILVTPLAFGVCMIFDHKNFANDVKNLIEKIKNIKLKFSKNK